MGVKELPFLFSQRSYGSLFLLPNDFSINITLLNGEWYVYNLGSMKYSSSNNYYMQRSYVYENGAVIASQSSGEALLMEPNIYISNEDRDSKNSCYKLIPHTVVGPIIYRSK